VVVQVVSENVVHQGRDHLGLVIHVCNVMGLVMGLVIREHAHQGKALPQGLLINVYHAMGLVLGLAIGRDHLGNDTVHFLRV